MSKRADRALRRGLTLVQPAGCVSVVSAIDDARSEVDLRAALETRLSHIKGWDDLADKAVIVKPGEASQVMTNESAALSATLAVIGMHRKRGLIDLVSGGTAARIIGRLPIPTLVAAHAVRSQYRRILVAIDYEQSARAALPIAAEWFPRAKLNVVHVLDFRPGRRSGGIDVTSELDHARRQWLADFVRKTLPPGVPVIGPPELMLEHGDPVDGIRQVAKRINCDLVITGSHRRSAVSRLFLGSVTRALLADPPTDLLVVPPLRR
jgi:nucleotide-binding universal stress UspA family protein